ncbi:hypothetical protein [Sphingomonas endolithica]|uniref:hypothetical protein n=1 Tax=Sphingomonas endolithica TaxID=2972485 RepID=UPI0021AF0EA1|nr:hypothetical protein [Sphingomonas sp. ZFBP2030]
MRALSPFYSVVGRVSIASFIAVAAVCAAVLWAALQADWQWGLVPNIVVGAVAGAAVAKLLVAAIRRLRDAGINLRVAAAILLVVTVITGSAFFTFLSSDEPWAEWVLNVADYGVPMICAVALLWPSRRDVGGHASGSDRAGVLIAISCVVGCAALWGFIAWLSIGINASNLRNAAFAQAVEIWDQNR